MAENGTMKNYHRLYCHLAAHHRSPPTDILLSCIFAFTAGAINSGGFLAIGQYTSHMTGLLASISDNLVLGATKSAFFALLAVITFCSGAAASAALINYLRRNMWGRQFAGPVLLEAILILSFGIVGTIGHETSITIGLSAGLLCFMMGLQNATITKITRARMRTTHVTGILTDIGIRIGNGKTKPNPHLSSLSRLKWVLLMFFSGGMTGAICFAIFGYGFCVPLAIVLVLVAAPPLTKSFSPGTKHV